MEINMSILSLHQPPYPALFLPWDLDFLLSLLSIRPSLSLYIYIYIYIYYAVKLLSGPSLGFLKVIIWSKLGFLKVIIWSKFVFLAYKNSGFKRFVLHTQLSFCVFFCAQLSGNFLKIAFFKKGVQKLGFSIFSVLSLNFETSLFLVC